MKTEFTPGPWQMWECGPETPSTICSPSHDDLANVYSCDDATVAISRKEAVANAYLIAAAPDLYAALEDMIDAYDSRTEDSDAKTEARQAALAALAKARGEQP